MFNHIVYMHTSKVNGKSYIGYTKRPITKRFSEHVTSANGGSKLPFHKAIRRYGARMWDSTILYMCDSLEEGYRAEVELIAEYNTYSRKSGYNVTVGGDRGPTLAGKKNGMYGRTHTTEVKQQLAANAKERFFGKSYEELYGIDKATELKQSRSTSMIAHRQRNPIEGKKNPNFDDTTYTFQHTSGQTFVGTQYDFQRTFELRRSDISLLIHRKQKSAKGWKLVG